MTSQILAWAAIGVASIWALELVAIAVVWRLWLTRERRRQQPHEESSDTLRPWTGGV